jgi:[acyl-carrier-protein] S-malonyltransferase
MGESRLVFLFPGQASQKVGMGKDLCERFESARRAFEEADDTLGSSISKLCFEGPMEELTQTKNAQPAILLHSVVMARLLGEAALRPAAVAGHSLGEFSAACAAGAFSLADALRIVRRRGELMWDAGERAPGSMAAVVGLERGRCEELCREISARGEGVVVVANLNSANQVVISGDRATVERAAEPLKEAGARRVMPLPVSGAFHSPLMELVRGEFAAFLAEVDFQDIDLPLFNNVAAVPLREAGALRESFVRQLVSPVLWHDGVAAMVDAGLDRFVEAGPGNVLTNLGARSFQTAQFFSTSDAEGLEKVLAELADDGRE